MKRLRQLMLAASFFAVQGCFTMNNGANWAVADFSAYNKNYREFDVALITIGMEQAALTAAMNMPFTVTEATAEYQVLQFEKWRAVMGPDYLEKKLLVRVVSGKVVAFRVTNDAVVTNPWS